jgi:hypothetical protein
MAIDFPKIKPSSLTFTPATYNVATPKFRDIIVSPRLLANKPNSPTLSLEFRNISAAKILSIFNAWENSYSGFFGLALPSEITSSITSTAFAERMIDPETISWRFVSEPVLSNVTAGVGDVSVQLKGDRGSPLNLPPSWVQQLTSLSGNVPLDYSRVHVITDRSGSVYVGVVYTVGSITWPSITKFSASGNLLWSKDINKNSGLGNSVISGQSLAPFFELISGGVVVTALYNNQNNPNAPSSEHHKIICLSSADGTIKWAKSMYAGFIRGGDVQSGFGVYTNSVTGHIYIVFNYFDSLTGDKLGLLTLDSLGNITACRRIEMPGTGGYGTAIRGIETRVDGSIVVYGIRDTGNFSTGNNRRGFTFEMDSAGTSMTTPLRLYGSDSDQVSFTAATLLSTGSMAAVGGSSFHIVNLSNGNYESCRVPAKSLGIQVLQMKERQDGTIAVLGWASLAASVSSWGGDTPSNPRTYVAVYSADMSQLIKYKVTDVGSSSFSSRDHARVVKGCIPSLDRYIAAPGIYAITSMDLDTTYERYETIQSYVILGNTFAKFASETASLPITTSTSTTKTVATPGFSTISLDTGSSDYTSSVTITNNTTQWSYFTA